jgi:hypothetical protein
MQLVSRAKVVTSATASTSEITSRVFHRSGPKRRDLGRGGGHEQTSLSFERDGKRLRFDLDNAVAAAHVQRHPGFQGGFAADFARNYESPG